MHRSEITIDLGAIRHNARRLLEALDGAELWAVVKANGYGHGATDVARAALEAGASALCVVTVAEAVELRRELPEARIIVMCPTDEVAEAREARLELVVSVGGEIPDDIPVHLKLDTGMGRWGLAELPQPPANVVGLMSHLATADSDPAFAQQQIERFREATEPYSQLTRHIANSAAALRLPEARFDAARCGIALYGISPFNTDPAEDGLRPALSWRSRLARVFLLQPGESTGYGRRFVAERPTWIGIVPVGYADGFRRDMTRHRGARRRRAAASGRHRLDGRGRGRARPRAAGRDAGHDRRRRPADRAPCARSPGRSATRSPAGSTPTRLAPAVSSE